MEVLQEWKPWTVGEQVGGYASEWTTASGSKLSVATVRGAGHMVPTMRPRPALALLYRAVHQLGWGDGPPAAEGSLKVAIQQGSRRPQVVAYGADWHGSVAVGDSLQLTVKERGTAEMGGRVPLLFAWRLNGHSLFSPEYPLSKRVNGAADAVLSVAAVKPSDAGLYEVEVSDVLGRHVGNMRLSVAVDLGCAASDNCCELPSGIEDADGNHDGCPDVWEDDGVCDRALCGGDALDCDAEESQTFDPCTDYAAFATRLSAINNECCDEVEEVCSGGVPMVCNTGCASVLLPAIAACLGFLDSPDAGESGAAVLAQLNTAAKSCSGSH